MYELANNGPKVAFLGDSNVGKTCLIWRAVRNEFNEYQATPSPSYCTLKKELNGSIINLILVDTAGQEKFASINSSYYRDANAIVIVYDICDKESFDHVDKYYNDISNVTDVKNVSLFLVGNKYDKYNDLNDKNRVSLEIGKEKAHSINANFHVTSAKSGNFVQDVFDDIASKFINFSNENTLEESAKESFVDIAKENETDTKSKCC